MLMELNYYYKTGSTGLGFHGDTMRRRVIGIRLGDTQPLAFQTFHGAEPVGSPRRIDLAHGDLYLLSEHAIGTDWKGADRRNWHVRHAAGAEKYVQAPTIGRKRKRSSTKKQKQQKTKKQSRYLK